MTEAISTFLSEVFKNNVVLATIIIAIIPLIELKGAIPFGMSEKFWGEYALKAWPAMLLSVLGGLIVTVVLALVFKPIYEWVKDKKFFKSFIDFFTSSARKKSEEVQKDGENKSSAKKLWLKILAVFVFVAIPLPGTGVYTGTCLGVLCGLKFWQNITAVTLGNLVAGIIIMTICKIFPAFTNIILYVFVVLILAFLIYRIIVHFVKKKNKPQPETNDINV